MEGCHKYLELWSDGASHNSDTAWADQHDSADAISKEARRPIAIYSKRSRMLAELRLRYEWATKRDDDFTLPTDEAFAAAETLINSLPAGVLDFSSRIAISAGGETNFFFANGARLFQLLIMDDGNLSYHAQSEAGELVGSEIALKEFPHMRLLRYLDGD